MIVVLVLFVMLYVAGVVVARKKSDYDKYILPKVIKQILFLGTFNKYRLGIIVYQSVLFFVTAATLVFGSFFHIINVLYLYFGLFMFLAGGIYSAISKSMDYSRHKEEYREYRKLLWDIRKAEKTKDEAELAALKNREAQLRDYLFNKDVKREQMQ